MDPVTPVAAFVAAKHTLSQIIEFIDAIAARREEKKRQRALKKQGEQRFLRDFMHAWAPDEDSKEEETIRSRCKKLQNVIKTHWQFIVEKGPTSAQAGHAHIAHALFHVASMPGLPVAPTTSTAVTERLVPAYNEARNELSDVFNRLENAQGYEVRELILRIEKVDKNVKHGFALGANIQAEFEARQAITASSFGFQPAMIASLDDVTSQTNVEDLVKSQSSPEELRASYSRVEHRCVQSISRNVSPASTQPSIYPGSNASTMGFYNQQDAFAAITQKLLPYASYGGEQPWQMQNMPGSGAGGGGPAEAYGYYAESNSMRSWRNPWG